MGIDGIGGSGRPPPSGGGDVGRPSGDFRVDGAERTTGADAADIDIQRLESGEWTLDQYLDARVARALEHLAPALSPEELGLLKDQLRAQLEADPLLQRLVRQATGLAAADNDNA
jgi:hypothetical protein